MSAPVTLEAARSRGAAVLARLPRPDQPGRRHRQRARGAGGDARRGDQDLRARSDQEEREDRLGAAAVLPASPSAPPARPAPQIDLGDAESVARGFIEDDKTKLTWNLPRALLPKNRVKLLLNMLLIAGRHDPARRQPRPSSRSARGTRWASRSPRPASMPASRRRCRRCSRARPESDAVDAHAIQPFYTGLLARACGLTVDARARGRGDRADGAVTGSRCVSGDAAAPSPIDCDSSGIRRRMTARCGYFSASSDRAPQPKLNPLPTH